MSPAAQPFGHGQESVRGGAQRPFFWFALGQGLRGKRGRGLGVAVELGEIAAIQRGQGRDIDQEAGRRAADWLERLIGPAGRRALSRVQQRFHHLGVAAVGGHVGLRQQQPGAGPDHVGGQDRQPAVDGGRLALDAVNQVEVLLDDPGRPEHLPGRGRVADGVVGHTVLLGPGRGVAVQLGQASGLLLLQAGAEQVGEQVVVAPPAAHLIQRDQEQPRPFGLLEQRLAALAAGDGVAQRAAEPVEHRRLEQERAQLLVLPVEHLFGQVVQDVPVAAGERGHEAGRIVVPAQGQRGQRQPGRPALGPGRQRRHRRIRQGRRRVLEQFPGLRGSEPQLGRAYLGQLAAGPQPRQRQRRVAAAGQHQADPGRPVLDQERERLVHLPCADHVVVVEDEQDLVRSQFVDQRRDQPLERRRRGRPEQRTKAVVNPGAGPVQRGHRVPPEPRRIIVGRVQRQPRGRDLAAPGPVSQQDRLAVPGRGADQDQPPSQALIEPCHQPRPRHQARPRPGHVQLGGEQGIGSRGCHWRLNHH